MMQKLGDTLKEMNIFKDIKYELNAGICDKCGENKLISINGKTFGICPGCQIKQIDAGLNKEYLEKSCIFLDEKFKDVIWDNYKVENQSQADVKSESQNFVNNFKLGKWALLYGKHGTGKTMLKNCILKDLAKFKILNITMNDIWTDYLDVQNQRGSLKGFLNSFLRYDILSIDEIGRRNNSRALCDFMFNLVDKFYINDKSLVLVSNLSINPKDERGQEINYISDFIDYSRLKEKTTRILFKHDDYRLK